MLSLLLLKLSAFVLWTTLLSLLLVVLQRRSAPLLQWPTLYWWLLLLASVPLSPQWQWPVALQLPETFLLDATEQIGQLTVTAQHPALVKWQPVELLLQALLAVVVLGACWQLWLLARQYLQLRTLYQLAQPVSLAELFTLEPMTPGQPVPNLDPRLEHIQIRQHSLAISPFIFGGRRAVLMLPAYYWQFNNQQRALLLAHELQHWQRRDPWQLLCWRIVVAICWFNPALRYFERSFGQAMELTVDRQVLAAQPQQALLYGLTLINSLKLCQQQATPGLASFIQASGDDAGYRQRLAALYQTSGVNARLRLWLPLLMLSLALLLNIGCSVLQGQLGPSGQWQLPVAQAKVNSGYGNISPIRRNRPHQGIDFDGSTGDPVFASEDGVVLIADSHSLHSRFGNVVLLDHGQGYQTLYAHLDTFSVQSGTRVSAGQQIGAVGATGVATGPHLHFELLQQGQQLDPTPLLQWHR
jgi:beta-lactamase regulating signal transducer with metallopeptidase domain